MHLRLGFPRPVFEFDSVISEGADPPPAFTGFLLRLSRSLEQSQSRQQTLELEKLAARDAASAQQVWGI